MPSQRQPVQINQFVGGLNTEANPLSFPINASADELNMFIERNGVRVQRPAMDVEESYVSVDTTIALQDDIHLGRSEFRWFNPGGDDSKTILVVQLGNYLGFHDVGVDDAISDSRITSTTLPSTTYSNNFQYAVVDGILVVATGDDQISIFEYDTQAETISESSSRLSIRDFFGTSPTLNSKDLWEQENYNFRPTSKSRSHIYNLRNQTFAHPRLTEDDNATLVDPIAEFQSATGNSSNEYPSNADNLLQFFYAKTSFTNLPTSDRYISSDNYKFIPSGYRAPQGHFIIDALNRGASRDSVLDDLYSNYSELTVAADPETELAADTTSGGISVVENYAGRVWFAGFSSELTDPEETSPLMGSYLLFSQVVNSKNEISRCYQAADPTDPVDNELVDTDGGFVRIAGAYDIVGLLSLGPALIVFARNGVWQVSGIDSNVFTATSFSVSKLSDYGCVVGASVVQVGSDALYWSDDGIYVLTPDQVSGRYASQSLTEETIKTFYDDIPSDVKQTAIGYHDISNNSVRWLYGQQFTGGQSAFELVLNTRYNAFTPFQLPGYSGIVGPVAVSGGFPINASFNSTVFSEGQVVTVGGEEVFIVRENVEIDSSSSFYCIVIDTTTTITYTFGGYREDTNNDWARHEGTGFLPTAYLETGPVSGSEGRLRKDVAYLTIHFPNKGDAGASCLFSAHWGWSQSASTGRWSSLREGYRYNTRYDNHDVFSTRNKVRGSGKAVAFRFESDENTPLFLYGWEYNLAANGVE